MEFGGLFYLSKFQADSINKHSIPSQRQEYKNTTMTTGPFAGLNLGLAITPAISVEVGGRYELGYFPINQSTLSINSAGPTVQVGVVWSPPALAFDPIDAVRSMTNY